MSSATATPDASARRVVVNADDFGFTPAVTEGILAAHAAGTVHRTSMMVHQPGWDHAVRAARAPGFALPIGLHLDLLVGAPLVPARTLTGRDGRFLPITALARRAFAGRVDPDEVAAETHAQIAALRAEGIALTHVDSHRHVHALPGIRTGVLRAAHEAGIGEVRAPLEGSRTLLGLAGPRAKAALLRTAWHTGARAPAPTRAFAGLALYGAGPRFADRLDAILDRLPAGPVEIIVHPGRVDDPLRRLDAYLAPREAELAALTSARVRERLGRVP